MLDTNAELLPGLTCPDGWTADRIGPWIHVNKAERSGRRVEQGWKLHIAARPATLADTVAAAAPALFDAGCDFKVAASPDLLRELNAGMHGASAVGKAITVYPPASALVALALRLAELLAGWGAPTINGDRRLRHDAPVYYRFGPFAPRLRIDPNGAVELVVERPDGTLVSGMARERYSAPDWLADPFENLRTPGTALPTDADQPVIGTHYAITGAVARTPRGTTYRAVDRRHGARVIVKEAKAFVNDTGHGDARDYLRAEKRVLGALDGVAGVPRVIDHFAYGPDEYLVSTELGRVNLRDDIVDHGLFAVDPGEPRDIWTLARALLALLGEIHARGIVYRDLAPKNIVVRPDGGWGFVDFELARCAGEQCFGWSAGYSHPRQRGHADAVPDDDLFSLGATLFHALTGLDPIVIDPDAGINRARTIACLHATCPADAPIALVIRDLLGDDPAVRRSAADRLRAANIRRSRHAPRALARPPLASILRHMLSTTIAHAQAFCGDDHVDALPPSITAYEGAAGLVAELAHHPRGASIARDLAWRTAAIAGRLPTDSGLLFGRMGIAVALHRIAATTADASLAKTAAALAPDERVVAGEQRVDVTHGLAGLGIGYLALADAATEPARFRLLAKRCANRLIHDQDLIGAALQSLPTGDPGHAISIADGFAHGRAGVAYMLLAHAAAGEEESSRAEAWRLARGLAALVPDLAARARTRKSRPMSASWCQGLAGIGTVLVRAAVMFDDADMLAGAALAASACRDVAPRVPLVTQCCGLAGTGELLLDLAVAGGDDRYHDRAMDILAQMLLRSGGSRTAPTFPGTSMAAAAPGWATGATGVLSFLRRLADPVSPRLWMIEPGGRVASVARQ